MEIVLRSCKYVVFPLWTAILSAGCLLLSPTSAYAQADLTEIDCMAAANPDACIGQLISIADQAAAPAPTPTPVNETTTPTAASSTTPAAETTAPTAQSTKSDKPTATSSQETKQPVKRAVKKRSSPSSSKPAITSQPAVTLAGTPANKPSTTQTLPNQTAATTKTSASQPATAVTLAGTSATPMPQPTPPVYKSTVTPEPVKPDLVADTMACQKTPDPDACVRNLTNKQGAPATFNPNALPLNSDLLGWSGPVKAALRYDSELSWIVGLDYVQMLSESVGISIKTGLGPRERRANITAGFAITPNQQIKATYEYLAQDLDFNFTTGTTREWVDQNAFGAAYQYLLRNEILHSIELSGYTVRANSKNLSDVVYNVQTAGNETTSYDVNYRRIAGGTENTVEAALKMLLTKHTSLTVGGGYSSLSYDTQYEDNQAKKTIAYQTHLTHLLSDKFKLMTGIDSTASGTTQTAELRHIFNNIELSLKGEHMSSDSLPSSNSMTVGISYPAPKAYSVEPFGNMLELKNWLEKPVVYKARVLAIKDEKVIHVLPTSDDFVQTIYTGPTGLTPDITKIVPIPMLAMFTFQDPGLTINYTCQVTAGPSMGDCGTLLNLAVGTPPGSSTTQLFSTASVPSTAASSSTAYTVIITATATRPGLQNPIVETGKLTLNVYDETPSFPNIEEIDFDTTGGATQPTAPLAITVSGLHEITEGINLNTASGTTGSGASRSFAFADSSNPPPYWQILQSGSNYYLLRNLDTQGQLSAADVDTQVGIPLCVYENSQSSQCVPATIQVKVFANAVKQPTNAGTIHVEVPTPFQIPSNQTLPAPDFNALSVTSLVSDGITIPVISDVYTGPWIFNSINPTGDWTGSYALGFSGSLLTNNSSATDITAPSVGEKIYNGTFTVKSKANGSSLPIPAANTRFDIIVTASNTNLVWDTTAKSIRFDLTNGDQDPGLKLHSGEQEIDLTAMVKDSLGNIVTGATFSWENASDPLAANWQFIPCPSNSFHTCLFRALKTSGSSTFLEAGDIGQKAPLICATSGNISCPSAQNFTVTPDTLSRSGGTKYVTLNNPSALNVCVASPVSTPLAPMVPTYFIGQSLTLGINAIRVNDDSLSGWGGLVRIFRPSNQEFDWNPALSLNSANSFLTGTPPIAINTTNPSITELYQFNTASEAAGGASQTLSINVLIFKTGANGC